MADVETIATLKRLAENTTFDELPCAWATADSIDWQAVEENFKSVRKKITREKARDIGIFVPISKRLQPSNGGVLLFGIDRTKIFPDAVIKCVRFKGVHRVNAIDHLIIDTHLPNAIDEILHFISKNTFTAAKITRKQRVDVPQYPPAAIREAVINAVAHTDYSIKGASIIVAIFDDRIEIANPGAIPPGLTLAEAIAGSSRARNRVIMKTFHLLKLVETWGSGLRKIIDACQQNGLKDPLFEEGTTQFRVTLYATQIRKKAVGGWEKAFLDLLEKKGG